jgi:Carboxypeptidase regulatory-like domain/Ankyrin repeats (3 copies)/Ankyrin repeats (many copies)
MSKKSFIDSVEVSSPCSEDWHDMKGTDKIRFCSHCSKNVNNLSEMTRKGAMRLVRASGGDLCIRYIQNPVTRRPLFADQLLHITRRAPGLAAGVMTASVGLSTLTYAQGGATPVRSEPGQTAATELGRTKPDEMPQAFGTISGTVADPNGAVIPGAKVSIFSLDAGLKETTTNDEGFYKFEKLSPGKYRIETESPGFKKSVMEMTLSTPDQNVADVAMEIGFEIVVDVVADVAVEAVVAGGVGYVEYSLPLSKAVADENVELVRELLVEGENPNGKDENYDNITPLFIAVENGNVEIVELLLNFGAKVNARDKQKRTPLMSLDDDATPELIELLVRHNVKLNLIDKEGDTVLILAAGVVDNQVLKALIDAGADVNVKNKEKRTPLMSAAEADELESVRVLLVAGAEVNARDKEGDSAWDLTSDDEVEKLLESYGAETRDDESENDNAEEP